MHAIKQESRRSNSSRSPPQLSATSSSQEETSSDGLDTPPGTLPIWAKGLAFKADIEERWTFSGLPDARTISWEKRSSQSPEHPAAETPRRSSTLHHHQQQTQHHQRPRERQLQLQPQKKKYEPETRRSLEAQLPLLWAAPTSTAVQRQRLVARFLDIYLFQAKTCSKQFTFMAGLAKVALKVPAMLAAVDALCLAGLGSAYNDDRCIQASRKKYCNALALLAPHIGRPPYNHKYQKEVFTTIVLLGFCEHFSAIAPPASSPRERLEGRISHLRGAESWLRACGPSIVTSAGTCSPILMLQIMMVRNHSWLLALVERKACLFAQPQWRQLTRSLAQIDAQSGLYDILLPLPGLMEEVDASMHSSNRLRYLYRRVSDLRKELDVWVTEQVPFELRDIRDADSLVAAGAAHTFHTVYAFESARAVYDHGLCWLFMLLVDCTLLRILAHHPLSSKKRAGGFEAIADVQRDIFVLSTHFCRMVPAWLRDASSIIVTTNHHRIKDRESDEENASGAGTCTFDSLAIWAFRFLVGYYEEYGMARELEWCRTVEHLVDPPQEEPVLMEQQQQQEPQREVDQQQSKKRSKGETACYNCWPPWQFYQNAAWPARLAL